MFASTAEPTADVVRAVAAVGLQAPVLAKLTPGVADIATIAAAAANSGTCPR